MRKYLRLLPAVALLFQFTTCTTTQGGAFGTVNIGGGGFGANFAFPGGAGGGGGAGIPPYGQPFQPGALPVVYSFAANP